MIDNPQAPLFSKNFYQIFFLKLSIKSALFFPKLSIFFDFDTKSAKIPSKRGSINYATYPDFTILRSSQDP